MGNKIREYFLPEIDNEVQQLIDINSTKSIEYISIAVVFFEVLTLILFVSSRKSFGTEEWISFFSVVFCIVTCLIGFLVARYVTKRTSPSHKKVMLFKGVYFGLMSLWAIWNAYRQYVRDEQIMTFYAVELMLVCFIALKPWLSTLLMTGVYTTLYVVLYTVDAAKGINLLNYGVLGVVSIIGMAVRYHSFISMSEVTVKLQKTKESEIQDKMNILKAIANIYENVNLIDFNDSTEMSVRDKEHIHYKLNIGAHAHTRMSRRIREHVMPDQLDYFIEYTDIGTVRSRLMGKKLISSDFIDVVDGWFRAQYIPIEVGPDGLPLRIIFTIRNVDEEKKREERLVSIAMTDELTRLFNRRCYEEDLAGYRKIGTGDDFVVMCADVNGLKKVNDTIGHAAGDELIMGAAECLVLAVGSKGKVYRTGGDEFVAILHTDDPETVCRDIESRTGNWKGRYSDELSISIGYAAKSDNRDLGINELEKKADDAMYRAKAAYYERKGIDRRHR